MRFNAQMLAYFFDIGDVDRMFFLIVMEFEIDANDLMAFLFQEVLVLQCGKESF